MCTCVVSFWEEQSLHREVGEWGVVLLQVACGMCRCGRLAHENVG